MEQIWTNTKEAKINAWTSSTKTNKKIWWAPLGFKDRGRDVKACTDYRPIHRLKFPLTQAPLFAQSGRGKERRNKHTRVMLEFTRSSEHCRGLNAKVRNVWRSQKHWGEQNIIQQASPKSGPRTNCGSCSDFYQSTALVIFNNGVPIISYDPNNRIWLV